MSFYDSNRPAASTGSGSGRPELSPSTIPSLATRAVVEYNADPEQRGRVKVRVLALHGPQGTDPKTRLRVEDLPWAMPCFPLSGGPDYGSFFVPPIGSSVWVLPTGVGETDQFIYLGGYHVVRKDPAEFLRAMERPEHSVSMVDRDKVWVPDPGPEVPKEALEITHSTPEVYVQWKTPKGAAEVTDDRDELEYTALIDRGGQGLFLETPVAAGPDANELNARQRGTRTPLRGKVPTPGLDKTAYGETRVMLVDAAGQVVEMSPRGGLERVRIASRAAHREGCGPHFKDEVTLELDAGLGRAHVTVASAGQVTAEVLVDGTTGCVEIRSDAHVRIVAPTVEIKGDLHVEGDVTAEGSLVGAAGVVGGEV